jgi:hypothetical protein
MTRKYSEDRRSPSDRTGAGKKRQKGASLVKKAILKFPEKQSLKTTLSYLFYK